MHNTGYYYFIDNICDNETNDSIDEFIQLGSKKIRTYGIVPSLIDCGQILNKNFEMNQIEKQMYNVAMQCTVDLFLLIEYVLINKK